MSSSPRSEVVAPSTDPAGPSPAPTAGPRRFFFSGRQGSSAPDPAPVLPGGGDDPAAYGVPEERPAVPGPRVDPMRVPRLVRPSTWTLRAKLVVAMVSLFTVVTLVTGAATVVALRGYLYGQIDDQLSRSLADGRLPGGPNAASCQGGNDEFRGPGDQGLSAFQALDQTVVLGCASDTSNTQSVLTDTQLGEIFAAGLRGPTNVDLGGTIGSYRLKAAQATATNRATGALVPGTVVVGLPVASVERTVGRMVALVLGGLIGGLLLVGALGTLIVRRSLRPLDRVAATATRVAQLPLDRGQVALAERLAPADTDVRTEVGQVGAALNEMLDHIDEALQARQVSEQRVRQFVADASHELRTPLASIRGYAELTRKEPEAVPVSVTHAIGRIESEGKRMSSLVEDLLLLARLDAGRPLETDTVDLTEMLINAVSDAHAASPEHVWQLDLPDEPVEVRGDTARLHQIVANLLANARTHTDPGTVVRTSLAHEPGRVRISVHDNGPGVPESLQGKVFARFARGDTSRNRAGGSTGLGLSIVAAVAAAHGGTVELLSRPGDTRFSVLLPA